MTAVWDDPGGKARAIYAARSVDDGRTWSKPRRLSGDDVEASHPAVVGVGRGGFLTAWTERTDAGHLVWKTRRL